MPFVEENLSEVIEKKRKENPDFRKIWDNSRDEYRLVGEMISLRKGKNLTQKDLATLTGSKQQVISRIEKGGSSPTLRNFCSILNALGYELRIVPKT